MGPEFVPDKTRTAFLDIARGLAAVLVVYTHIYDVFIHEHKGVTSPPTDAIDNAFVNPLKLDDQGIGAISVPMFFVISGFVVTPIALRMGANRFGINRLLRIYPLLIFVVTVSAVLIAVGRSLLSTRPQDITVGSFLSNVTLWNFIDRPFGAWVAVAWTLAIEILFYAMLVAVLPLLRKRAWLAIAVQLEFILILLITYRAFGDEYRALVINMVYTLIPIMGQAVWAAWSRKIPAWLAGVYVTVAWLLFVWAEHLKIDPDYIPRPFPVAIALLLFLLGLFAEPYLRQRRFWTELSERTYSIYLLHGSVAFPLMHLLFNTLPLWLTVLVAVVATALAAEVSYRFVERPSHDLARRLSRRRAATKEPEPEPEEDDDVEEDDEEDDLPTEKTPPVAAPRRRPVPAEVETEKIEPVVRAPRRPTRPPRRDTDDLPTQLTPVIRDTESGGRRRAEERVAPRRPDGEANGHPIRNGRRRAPDGEVPRPGGRRRAEDREPEPGGSRNAAAGPRHWPPEDERPATRNGSRPTSKPDKLPTRDGRTTPEPDQRPPRIESDGRPARGSSRPAPEQNPHRLGRADELPPRNGSRVAPELGLPTRNGSWAEPDDIPARGGSANGMPARRGGRRRAEDILNGTPNDSPREGGRRRAPDPPDPTRFVPAGGAGRRAEHPRKPANLTWPGEQDDPDDEKPSRGRHRSD